MLGRDNEIEMTINEIMKRDSNSNTVIISSIDGMPAVGKTTLAVRVAHMLSVKYSDAQLFIDCYGYTAGHQPLDKEKILDSLLFALGISIKRIPKNYEDKLSLWRLELNSKSVIVVFDNVKFETQVDELIPHSTDSLFIITSRNRLMVNDSYPITVDVLDQEASVLVLNNGVPEEDKTRYEMLVDLACEYGNLPMALQIISHQIKGRSCKYIQRLINNRNKFENLGVVSDAVFLSFDISYRQLKDSEQKLLNVLGLFPGYDFTAGACAAMLGTELSSVYRGLDVLYQHNLIKRVADERYVLHDLMRDFTREKYRLKNMDSELPIIRLIQYYIECVKHCNTILYPYNYREDIKSGYDKEIDELPTEHNDALWWLSNELNNILACLDVAKSHNWHQHYFNLAYVLSQYIMKSLPSWQVVQIYQILVEFEELDEWMQVAAITNLGLAYHQVCNFDKAVEIFIEAEAGWTALENWKALANTLGNHAFTLERLGRYSEALNIIEQALKYETQWNNLSGRASILNCKGAVYWRMEEYSKARQIFEEVIEIREEMSDDYGAANSINNLAFTMLRLGDVKTAREGFAKSLSLSRSYQDYSGEAVTLNNFGYTELFSNQPQGAIKYADDAFDIASKIGEEYQVARSYDVKGRAYLQMRQRDNAINNFELALTLFEKLNVPEAEETRDILKRIYT